MKNRWNKKVVAVLAVMVGVLMFSVSILAHHGTGISYDRTKEMTVKAVVTGFKYANPHPQLYFDVTDAEGKVTHWSGELAPTPYSLALNGWNRARSLEALKAGTKVTITLSPSRAGTPVALVDKILNEGGKEILGEPVE
jgi:hypothetical protein